MAIAAVTIDSSTLTISPIGINKFWGFRGDFHVPLAHVVRATVGEASQSRSKGLRFPGLGWVNRWVGRFRKDGEWHYWCAVTGPTLEIELRDEYFARLILSVDDPVEISRQINERIG